VYFILMGSQPPEEAGQNRLSRLGIAGGAVYDALVALAAQENGTALATTDARARGTYDAVGVTVILVV
jgi:toxin FitB